MTEDQYKITIVVNGRFHAFDYAAELYKLGKLHRLISSMPYAVAKKFEIGRETYVGLPFFEMLKFIWRKLFNKELPVHIYSKLFTFLALRFIPHDTKCIISFAGYSKEIFRSERFRKSIKILDRGSTHTLKNIELNQEAAAYHNIKWKSHSESFIKRELDEYKLADKILIPSTFVKNTFLEKGIPEQKLIQIPYAFSSNKIKGIKINNECKKRAVLFVGQICPRKGVGVLLEAMTIVNKKMKVELWLVGSKHSSIDKKILKSEWIKYYGVLKGEELIDKYIQASIFCLPSFEEGFGLVLNEAKHFNLPIISTPNTGAIDINCEDLFLVEPGNHIELAEKIMYVFSQLPNKNCTYQTKMEMSWTMYCKKLLESLYNII